MRGAIVLFGVAIALIGAGLFISLPKQPAKERLSGVTVQLAFSRVATATDGRKQLWVDVIVQSIHPIGECLRFALDEPFGNRSLDAPLQPDGCIRPDPMALRATLRMPRLDEMDTYIPDHELLWGGAGGCGPIMGFMGMCSVDTVGMLAVKFPVRSVVPTMRPGQTFGPFVPFPTFDINQFNY